MPTATALLWALRQAVTVYAAVYTGLGVILFVGAPVAYALGL